MAHIFAIANQKGGVGKTNVSYNLAGSLAEKGHKVLLVDMDGQASLTSIMFDDYKNIYPSVYNLIDDDQGLETTAVIRQTNLENIDILPAGKKLQKIDAIFGADFEAQEYLDMRLEPVRDQYDFIIIDCPPKLGTGTQMSMIAATGLIVPTERSDLSINEVGRTIDFMKAIKKSANTNLVLIGIIINKLNTRRKLQQEYRDLVRQQYRDLVFKAEFKDNKQYAETSTHKQPVTQLSPKSEQAEAYRILTKELFKRIN